MFQLYEYVDHHWLLVNTYNKLKSAVCNALKLHESGERIKITDKNGDDYTDLIWEQ